MGSSTPYFRSHCLHLFLFLLLGINIQVSSSAPYSCTILSHPWHYVPLLDELVDQVSSSAPCPAISAMYSSHITTTACARNATQHALKRTYCTSTRPYLTELCSISSKHVESDWWNRTRKAYLKLTNYLIFTQTTRVISSGPHILCGYTMFWVCSTSVASSGPLIVCKIVCKIALKWSIKGCSAVNSVSIFPFCPKLDPLSHLLKGVNSSAPPPLKAMCYHHHFYHHFPYDYYYCIFYNVMYSCTMMTLMFDLTCHL